MTDAERDAVLSFQDLGSRQDSWTVEAPDPVHVNCSIVNSYLRFPEFRDLMSGNDVCQCEEMLVERGCEYVIKEISPVDKGILSPDTEAIVYILRRI